jgi:uncharacterized protein (TIGR02145 family)
VPELSHWENLKQSLDLEKAFWVNYSNSPFIPLSGGGRNYLGVYDDFDLDGYWWTLSEGTENTSWIFYIDTKENNMDSEILHKGNGISIRCVKNK